MATIVQQTNGEKTIYTADEYTLVQKSLTSLQNQINGLPTTDTVNGLSEQLAEKATKTTQDLTYYVSPTGNDSNDGLSASAPFATIQKAIDTIPSIVKNNITIQLADGTYTNQTTAQSGSSIDTYTTGVYNCCVAITNKTVHEGASLTILGNPTTKANVVIDGQSTADIGIFVMNTKRVNIKGVTVQGAKSYNIHYKRYSSGQMKNVVTNGGQYGLYGYEYCFLEIQGDVTIQNATIQGVVIQLFSWLSATSLTMNANAKGILVSLSSNVNLVSTSPVCVLNNTGENLTIEDSSYCYGDTVTFSGGNIATVSGRLKLNVPTYTSGFSSSTGHLLVFKKMSVGEILTPNFNSNTTPSSVTTSGIVCFDMAKVEVINGSIKQLNHGIYAQDNSKLLINGTDLSNNRYDGINASYSQIECIGVKSTTSNGRYGYNLTSCIYYDGGSNTVTGATAQKNGTAVAFTAV